MATLLVVGASGMTGMSLVEQLLANNHEVRIIVRATEKFSAEVLAHKNLKIFEHSVLDISHDDMAIYVQGCDAIVSCLGHVLSFKGMFGEPKQLCTEAVQRLSAAIEENGAAKTTKLILMNTVGVKNPESDTLRTWHERALLGLLSFTLPPQRDNETAAAFLQQKVGKNNPYVEWSIVRPDTLINADLSLYDIQAAPTTGIISGRPTARANVAHFMVQLIENDELWQRWKFKMPVIMNCIY